MARQRSHHHHDAALPPSTKVLTEIFHGHEWAPAIRDGDTLLIDTSRPATHGDFVCARQHGRCILGDLEQRDTLWVLIGPSGEELAIDTTVHLLGVIIGMRRP